MESLKKIPEELDDEGRAHIRMVFDQEVVPRLKKLDARLGTLECSFAGERYRSWVIEFRSVGSDFEIVDFVYDEEADSMDLDL